MSLNDDAGVGMIDGGGHRHDRGGYLWIKNPNIISADLFLVNVVYS